MSSVVGVRRASRRRKEVALSSLKRKKSERTHGKNRFSKTGFSDFPSNLRAGELRQETPPFRRFILAILRNLGSENGYSEPPFSEHLNL
jgi:hypothetical protein